MKKISVEDKSAKMRIDVFLAEELNLSRSHVKNAIERQEILVNEKPCKAGQILRGGDEITVDIPAPKPLSVVAEDIPLDLVYQDDYFAVINKPQGMVVHYGNGNYSGTLVNALLNCLDNLSGINGVLRPGIVHRIDKNTSGLLVVAKCDEAHISLSRQIQEKSCFRYYLALLEGNLKTDSGRIETKIGRSDKDRTKMAVKSVGRTAITNYKVIERFEGYTLCQFKLETGRTHQIRVHAKYLGHPIVGDKEYGVKKQKFDLEGQLLHAYKLELTHPKTGKRKSFEVPLPPHFESVLKKLKKL